MAKKRGAANIAISELSDAIDEAIGEIAEELYEEVDRGLDKAARHMERALQQATPVDTGETRETWETDFKYKNVRYINNTHVNENGIPVVNLLEYGKKGHPFIRKTVQNEQEKIIEIIKGEIENGKT